jgi:hypothetical protein
MAMTDRAFRALAQAEPEVIVATLGVVARHLVDNARVARIEDVGATRLDALSPPRDLDWAVFIDDDALLHTECQGYRDVGFSNRVFDYHLWLVLRHPTRRVRTAALWLIDPPHAQSDDRIIRGDLSLRVTHIVLPRQPAEAFLDDPKTACFAAGAHRGAWSVETLCERVACALAAGNASWYQRHMAVIAAAVSGRYDAMVKAMERQHLEPIIIEDLVLFGEDRGVARGRSEGLTPVARQFERRLQRPLTDAERALLVTRLETLGGDRLGDVVLDLSPEALAVWIADPNAH